MKIILFANHTAILPAIDYLHAQSWLAAVIYPEKQSAANMLINTYCRQHGISCFSTRREELTTALPNLLCTLNPDLAFMCGFPYRLPASVFTIPPLGFFNIHFSLLPAYRGPDPIFWQLKNGESTGGITIHSVNQDFDSGAIVQQSQIPFIPGESWGICNSRYSGILLNMLVNQIEQLLKGDKLPQPVVAVTGSSYYPRPLLDDLLINWETQTMDQIENLVNACNPLAGGAVTYLQGEAMSILEVSPVEGTGESNVAGGTIIHADAQGLFVQCADRHILRVNILKINDGFITGFKLRALGIKKGDAFTTCVTSSMLTN